MDAQKKLIRRVVVSTRPDLERELLFSNSEVYKKIFKKGEELQIPLLDEESVQEVWTIMNLENPVPHLTAEINLVFEENFPQALEKLFDEGIYNETKIQIAETKLCQMVYEKYEYGTDNFAYSNSFDTALKAVVSEYLRIDCADNLIYRNFTVSKISIEPSLLGKTSFELVLKTNRYRDEPFIFKKDIQYVGEFKVFYDKNSSNCLKYLILEDEIHKIIDEFIISEKEEW